MFRLLSSRGMQLFLPWLNAFANNPAHINSNVVFSIYMPDVLYDSIYYVCVHLGS